MRESSLFSAASKPASAARELLGDQRGAVFVEHIVMVSIGLVVAYVIQAAGVILIAHFTGITRGLYLGVP